MLDDVSDQALAEVFPFDGNFVKVPGVVLHPLGLARAVTERLAGVNRAVIKLVLWETWNVMAEALLSGNAVSLMRIGVLRPALRCNRLYGHAWAELRFHASPWMRRALKQAYPRLVRLAEQVYIGLDGKGETFTPVDEDIPIVEDGDGDTF